MKCPRCGRGELRCVRSVTVEGSGRAQERRCSACDLVEIHVLVVFESGVARPAKRLAALAERMKESQPQLRWDGGRARRE